MKNVLQLQVMQAEKPVRSIASWSVSSCDSNSCNDAMK